MESIMMEDAKARKLHLRGSAIEAKYDDIERSLKNGSHARRVFCTSITNDDILMHVSVKWSTHIEGHFPLLESSTPVDDQITDSSSVRRCTVAGYRAGKQKKQSKNDEKYKLDLPWIDQTPKSPAGHGLVSPKGEQPKSSRLHFNHVTLRGGWTKTWVKVRCAALCLMDLLATVANSRNYKFTQSTPFFPFLIFRVERIGSKPNDVSSSPLGHTVSRTFHFFAKHIIRQLAELILSSASGLPSVATDMVRVHERGGGSSTPLSTPSNNRARSARNRNAFYGFFMNLPEELFLTLWMNIFGIFRTKCGQVLSLNFGECSTLSQQPEKQNTCASVHCSNHLKETHSRGQQHMFYGL
ncbi:hypothetical protein T08_2637 [Trichinella sp. T8]|nr:hypothetical protein T08_2637 [Trichinella sp. T8]